MHLYDMVVTTAVRVVIFVYRVQPSTAHS